MTITSPFKVLLTQIRYGSRRLTSNIAFVPSLMVLFAFALAIFILYMDFSEYGFWQKNEYVFIFVRGADNARMVLTTIIGGMISLTVFSFSMVMVVLNQASDSLSPRVLPQLIASRTHQVVLGFYMGTIVYSLMLITNLNPGKDVPALGILLSMIFAVISLGMFIYFIRSISRNIQVDHVLEQILDQTKEQLESMVKDERERKSDLPDINSDPTVEKINISSTGYCRLVNLPGLVHFLAERNLILHISVHHGQFLNSGDNVAVLSGGPAGEEVMERIANHVFPADDGDDEFEFHFGFRKISEIAVKALSPGINDPGTALRAVRYLTILLSKYLQAPNHIGYSDKKGNVRIIRKLPSADYLLTHLITPIRKYAAGSIEIYGALFDFFRALLFVENFNSRSVVLLHLRSLANTVEAEVKNPGDRHTLNEYIDKLNKGEDLGQLVSLLATEEPK